MPVTTAPGFALEESGEQATLRLTGDWTAMTIHLLDDDLAGLKHDHPVLVDVSGLTRIDTAGAWKLFQLLKNDEVQFFKVGVSFAPKLKVQESRSLNVDLNDLGSISTSDLLAVLGLSAIEQAEVDEGE